MIWAIPTDDMFPYEYHPAKIETPWGWYYVYEDGGRYKLRALHISPGQSTPYQRHLKRNEFWYVKQGSGHAMLHNTRQSLAIGDTLIIYAGMWHQLVNTSKAEVFVIHEFQYGEICSMEDIQCL